MKQAHNITTIQCKTYLLRSVAILLNLCFLSCQVAEDLNLLCVGNIKPELPDHQFKEGWVNHYYNDVIKASVDNEPNDDYYDYFFSVEGRIPEGIEIKIEGRTVWFEGIPTQSGRFKFTVFLEIEPHYPEPAVCIEFYTSREYDLTINLN